MLTENERNALNHICFEFRYGNYLNKEQIVVEHHGYIDSIDEYSKCLISAISPTLEKCFKDGVCLSVVGKDAFQTMENTFFSDCKILVNLSRGKEVKYNCDYLPLKSIFKKDFPMEGANYFKPCISLQIQAPNERLIVKILAREFGHELLHAYEDFNRRINNGSIDTHSRKTRYYASNYYWKNPKRKNQDAIAYVINRLNDTERNAILGQLKIELLDNRANIEDSISGWNELKKTNTWKTFEGLEQNLDIMLNLNNSDDTVFDFITSFNEIMGTNYKTLSKIQKMLGNVWQNWKQKFITVASKIVYDVYCTTIIDGTSNEPIIYKR